MALRCAFCVIASYLFLALIGIQAQESSPAPATPAQPEKRTRIIYKEKSYYEYEDTLIRGDREGPGGLNVFRKDRVKFKSQLNLSRSFMPELKSSSEDAQ